MKETRALMGMPITVEIVDEIGEKDALGKIFDYFKYVEDKFSVFKDSSEITKINKGLIEEKNYSEDMKTVFKLSEQTRQETDGYFDIINSSDKYNPSGLVKGWAINNAAKLLRDMNCKNFCVEAGGDLQVNGKNKNGEAWKIGIKSPFKTDEVVKVIYLAGNEGIATSGTYIRGQHVYNPKDKSARLEDVISISVIGPNIYEADRFATAAFAMQREGINFIEKLDGFEAYMIDKAGVATMTSGFEAYTNQNV